MGTLQILGYIFESIALISGGIAAYFAIQRDPKKRVNQLMAIAMVSITLYILFIMIYDVVFNLTNNPQIILISYPQAIISIVASSIFLYLTMQTITRSSLWLNTWWHWGIHVIILFIFGIVINVVDFISINIAENVDTQISYWVLAIVVFLVLFYLSQSIWIIYKHGIQKSTGRSRQKLQIFAYGLFCDFFSIFVNIAAQITSNQVFGQTMDVVFFGMIALGNVIYSISFSLPSEKGTSCITCDI